MQLQRANFTCTALIGTNKAGILKPNADGYYTMVLGALEYPNSTGAVYPYGESAKQLFKESSSFIRRINDGALRGECGHPRQQPGQSRQEFIGRVLDIYEPNVSHHIRRVWLDYDSVKDKNGRRVLAVMGEVKPCGPMGPALKASLDNPSENVCFSIRSLTTDQVVGGTLYKHLKTIVTWDLVNEPGLVVAKKWLSPSLEQYEESVMITPAHLNALRKYQTTMGVSMESSGGVSAEQALKDLGWITASAESLPPSSRW